MTLAKRLLLGTAAAFVATSGAHAADLGLPVAPSVEYVQVCSIGTFTGFLLPGGDVCMDISGYARGQLTWSEEIDPWDYGYGEATVLTVVEDNTAGNFIGPVQTLGNGTGNVTFLSNITATAATNAAANAGNMAALLVESGEFDLGDITTLGYNSALVTGVFEEWHAFDVHQAGVSWASIAAFGGGLQIANAGTVGGGLFAANDVLAGLELLAVAGNNDENLFEGNARIEFDARTMTEYGLLRGHIRLDGENSGAANVDRAFVQLNVGSLGFTAGLASSAFDPEFTGYGSGAAQGLGLADQASNQFSVNAFVGNGVTVSLSIEDDDARSGSVLGLTESDLGTGVLAGGSTVATVPGAPGTGGLWTLSEVGYDGGASIPDLVAAIRVDQAWGSAKLAAALHEVNPAGSSVDSEFGYAVSGSAEFNIPVGVGSTFGVTGIYAHGAQQFMGFNNEVGNSSTGFADAILVSSRSTVGGAGVTTRALDLTTSYVIAAGFNFGVNNMVALSLDGSYADVDHYGNLFDGNVMTIRGGIAYTPVNNLTINAHVSYASSDFNTSALRATVDDDEWGARFRVTRSF